MKNRLHSRAFLLSPAVSALTFVLAVSSAQAVTYYKADNETNLNNAASWLDDLGNPATTSSPNSTSSTDVWIWDNRVTDLNSGGDGVNDVHAADQGVKTIRILDPEVAVRIAADVGSSGRTMTYTSGGGIDMANATQDLTIVSGFYRASGGITAALNVATGRKLEFLNAATLNVRSNSSGGTFNMNTDGTSAGHIVIGGTFNPSNLVIGAGLVEFNSPSGTSRNGTNSTTVNGGTLMVNNTSGSATGSGAVTVNNTGTLGGQGIISGTVTAASGSTLAPGNNTVGSLSVGNLNLQAGSTLNWEITDPVITDVINVTNSNGLTIEGGTFNLYNPGTTTPFGGIGDFPLFNYSGAISGAGIGALAVSPATMVPGHTYVFAISGGVVKLRITAGAITQTYWDVDSNGDWSLGSNWTGGVSPNAVGTHAAFGGGGTPITAPRTVTVDGTRTTSSLLFDSAQPFTLAGTGPLTLDDGGFASNITVNNGSHGIDSPVSLVGGGALATVETSASLTVGGVIDGPGFGVSKTGDGLLVLSANNTYTGTTSIGAGILQIGAGATSGAVDGPIANSGTLRFNRSDDTSISNQISGSGNLDQAGSGQLEIALDTTFTGITTISNGSLLVGSSTSLQNSTLNYSSTGGTISFSGSAYPVILGGLSGDGDLPMIDLGSFAVALQVGGNNQSTTYSGSGIGIGDTLTKNGTGTLTLTGTHEFGFNTTVSRGVLEIATGGDFTTGGFGIDANAGAKLLVSGGSFESTSLSTSIVPNASGGIQVTDGTATFSGDLNTSINTASGTNRIIVNGGSLDTTGIRLGRSSLNFGTSEPAAGQVDGGLYINGGAANISGTLNIGNGENSSVSTRMDSGSLTVGGQVLLGINSPDRWSILDINGGTFTSTDAVDGVLIGGTASGQVTMLVREASALAKAERVQFGQLGLTGQSYLNLSAGALYVGGGGMVLGSTEVGFTASVRLSGGVLGATADSVSDVPVSLTGSAEVTAADETDTPHNVTLAGPISGSGSLTKSGSGTLILSGTNTHSGDTNVTSGVLAVTGNAIDDGASLAIDGGKVEAVANETVGTLFLGGVQQEIGTYGAVGSGAGVQNDTYFAGTTGVINVTIGPIIPGSYAAWSLTNAPGQSPGEDYNNNGLANGVEYFMGLTLGSPLPNIGPVNGTITWPKDSSYLGTFMIQTSDTMDAGDWDDVPVNGANPIDNGTSVEFTPPTGLDKIFTRLRVTPN